MATLGQFGNKMIKRSVRVEANLNRKVRRIALAIFSEVVVQTPVDTGRARSNWVVSLGHMTEEPPFSPYVPGKDGSTAAANSTAAIQIGMAAMSDRRPEQDIFITNNLPYIGRLNEGYSAQAPANYIQSAVQFGIAAGSSTKVID